MNESEQSNSESFRAKIGAILFLTAIFFINFLARVMPAPLMPTMENDLGLGHSQAGSLFLMISLGYFVTMAASGFISARLGQRRTVMVSALGVGLGMFMVGFSQSLSTLRLAFIVVGLGAGLYLSSGVATITNLVGRQNWGKALAIHEMAPNLGLILAPLLAELFLLRFSWRMILLVLGAASMVIGVAYVKFGRGVDSGNDPPRPAVILDLMKQRSFWLMMALFGLGVGGSMGIYNLLPLYLVTEGGLDREMANTVVSLSRISGLFMAFVSGWAADRMGPKRAMMAILVGSGLTTIMLGLLSGPWLWTMIFVQAALAASYFPAGFAALSLIGKPSERNIVISMAIPLAFVVGGGLFPALVGYLGEVSSFALGVTLVGGLIMCGPILVFLLRFREPAAEG
jgi:NNP family nitrate/nitrite transporter-like MFS transporter